MATFRTWDESGTRVDIEAETAELAAREYVDSGDWADAAKTWWCHIQTVELDDDGEEIEDSRESHTIAVDPTEPSCPAGEHDWQSQLALVGGIRENPGVFGHGGGVVIRECCVRCGCGRVTDTWAQDPSNGVQGLRSTEYREGEYDVSGLTEEANA